MLHCCSAVCEENENEPIPPVNSRLITRSSLEIVLWNTERTFLFSFSHGVEDQFLLLCFSPIANRCCLHTVVVVVPQRKTAIAIEERAVAGSCALPQEERRNYGYVKWETRIGAHSCSK